MLRQVTALGALWLALAGGLAGAQITPDSLTGLQPGDLLFKGAETATGTRVAAGWSLGDKRWGHVGIVAADGVSVIHADTGENGRSGDPGEVRRVPLSDYISDATNSRPLYNFSHWLSAGGVSVLRRRCGRPALRPGLLAEDRNQSQLFWNSSGGPSQRRRRGRCAGEKRTLRARLCLSVGPVGMRWRRRRVSLAARGSGWRQANDPG